MVDDRANTHDSAGPGDGSASATPSALPSGSFTENVIPTLAAWRRSGADAALLTLINVEGSSPRPVGAQMAVREDGTFIGNITSGCAEGALVAEAQRAMRRSTAYAERYGRGSRYLDIQLPCGSGIDVFFDPLISNADLDRLDAELAARRPTALRFETGPSRMPRHGVRADTAAATLAGETMFERVYMPATRVVVAGRGPAVGALCAMARALDWEVVLASPGDDDVATAQALGAQTRHLNTPADFDASLIDAWTAVVLLFHDHDWEPPILAKALNQNAFYFGAMGSRRTHQLRRDMLSAMGVAQVRIDLVRGPIGLDVGATNPPEIALSIAGEILATLRHGAWTKTKLAGSTPAPA